MNASQPLSPPPHHPWWQRLHAALMPDYNPRVSVYWWLVVAAGGVVIAASAAWLAAQDPAAWLQVAAGLLLALGAGLFPVRVPGTRQSFVAGEVFIFLTLLVLGPAAAVLVAAGEAAMGAARSSRRWTSRLFSPASAALAMGAAGTLLHAVLARLDAAGAVPAATLLAATMVCASACFFVNAMLVGGVLRLKRNETYLQALDLLRVFRWVGLAYAGSAALAALLYVTVREQGIGVLLVMVPLLAALLFTLHLYFRQQEAVEAMRETNADAAAREAAAAVRHLQALQASERRFHSAFTHAAIGMALLDFGGRILQANAALAALLGWSEAELARWRFQDFVLDEDRAGFESRLGLTEGREFEVFAHEVRCRHREGETVWLALHCSFFTEPEADAPCLILQAQDVSARRRAEAGLEHMAFHDALTGLPNRRRFSECLEGAVARCRNDARHPWAVMFIDFDRFKIVNDSLGHSAGDELLQQMARRIQEKLRPSDIVARLGGDEFAVLADKIEHEGDAIVLAERLMEALRRPFLIGEVELVASASIGITFSALGYDSAEAVLRDADTAMYKAKSAGKARYAIFDASLHTAVSDRLRLEGELRQAIERGELALEYQPVLELGGDGLAGFEALVRWPHPHDGPLQPAAFLGIAAESGQMLRLSDFVLHCACHQLRQWQLSDPRWAALTISVNLSAHDLAHAALVARVTRALVESGLRPEHLTLELSEDVLMAQVDAAVEALAALRRLGVRLAVDDFGAGQSSLAHLTRLPVDGLKIDRSFVHQLDRGADDAAVVAAIVRLGQALRKTVVAEGVETSAQVVQLREFGCGWGQGFHLAPPMAGPVAGEWLRERGAAAPG